MQATYLVNIGILSGPETLMLMTTSLSLGGLQHSSFKNIKYLMCGIFVWGVTVMHTDSDFSAELPFLDITLKWYLLNSNGSGRQLFIMVWVSPSTFPEHLQGFTVNQQGKSLYYCNNNWYAVSKHLRQTGLVGTKQQFDIFLYTHNTRTLNSIIIL